MKFDDFCTITSSLPVNERGFEIFLAQFQVSTNALIAGHINALENHEAAFALQNKQVNQCFGKNIEAF